VLPPHTLQEDASEQQQKGPPAPLIEPKHDPMVIAASAGHLGVVKALEGTELLCPPCAAPEAARHNHTAVVEHLATGSAKVMMQVRAVAVVVQACCCCCWRACVCVSSDAARCCLLAAPPPPPPHTHTRALRT
jgi:hypothetical protein